MRQVCGPDCIPQRLPPSTSAGSLTAPNLLLSSRIGKRFARHRRETVFGWLRDLGCSVMAESSSRRDSMTLLS
jgi:hypothetical protein